MFHILIDIAWVFELIDDPILKNAAINGFKFTF